MISKIRERCYYKNSIANFTSDSVEEVIGAMLRRSEYEVNPNTRYSWEVEIITLQELFRLHQEWDGGIAFELLKMADEEAKEAKRLEKSDPTKSYEKSRLASYHAQKAISSLDAGYAMNNDSPKNKTLDIPTAKQNNAE